MIHAGEIIFVKNNGLFSDLIRYFDKGRFSHVCVAISNTHVVEAQYGTKVRITPFYYGQDEYVVMNLNLTEKEIGKVVEVALEMTGKWYDYGQILGIALQKIFKLESKNLFNNPNNWICSELVYHMLVSIGKIAPLEKLNNLTPNQLYNFLENICKSQDANCTKHDNILETPTEIEPKNLS